MKNYVYFNFKSYLIYGKLLSTQLFIYLFLFAEWLISPFLYHK